VIEAAGAARLLMTLKDLFDNMYELVDSLTFKSRSISPNMWRVFELTYELFQSDAIDFLDGSDSRLSRQRQRLT
jgi:hypothetical protein